MAVLQRVQAQVAAGLDLVVAEGSADELKRRTGGEVRPGVASATVLELIAGTTLFMPVFAAGALFSAGDAHAAQGHGEVDLTADDGAGLVRELIHRVGEHPRQRGRGG